MVGLSISSKSYLSIIMILYPRFIIKKDIVCFYLLLHLLHTGTSTVCVALQERFWWASLQILKRENGGVVN